MKIKILILAPVRLDGINREPGENAELDESLINRWIELGYCEVYKNNNDGDKILNSDDDKKESQYELNHVGGGYYLLPDGSKIHGKEKAIKALAGE